MDEWTAEALQKSLEKSKVPEHIHEGLIAHVMRGREVGGFLTAVLENNLKEACWKADSVNQYRLFDIVSWLYNETPAACWGSPEEVKAWREKGGIEGR